MPFFKFNKSVTLEGGTNHLGKVPSVEYEKGETYELRPDQVERWKKRQAGEEVSKPPAQAKAKQK